MAAANFLLQNLDKGLRSHWPPEQYAVIAKLSKIFKENPVPTLINAMLVRLADAFKDGTNDLRVAIARSLSQCGSQLSLAFSAPEIFRRILVVSHSNDANARETTLDVLSALAQIYPESSQAHHLISESLTSSHDGEFRAACTAIRAFSELSSTFAEIIVPQVGKLLDESSTPEERKVLLSGVFCKMNANAQTMEQVFAITGRVLTQSKSDEFISSFLDSTTSLCIEIRYAIPRQIDILLKLLESTSNEDSELFKHRIIIILRELKRLAMYSNIWNPEQITKFSECLHPTLSNSTLRWYFDIAIGLSRNCPKANLFVLKDLVLSGLAYGSVSDPEISVRYLQLAANILCVPGAFDINMRDIIESTMTSLSIIFVAVCAKKQIEGYLAKRLYSAIGDILCAFPYKEFDFSSMILAAVFSVFSMEDISEYNLKQRLELFCRLVDTDKLYINDVHKWAVEMYSKKKDICNLYPEPFAYLLSSIGTRLPQEYPRIFFDSDELKYRTARCALRNGKWKEIAFKNLSEIGINHMNKESGDWISALREIAASEVDSFSLQSLEEQRKHLAAALSILNVSMKSKRYELELRFPVEMVKCMLKSCELFSSLYCVISPFLVYLPEALKPGKFFNPITAKRFSTALSTLEAPLNEAVHLWSALCRTSFCADPTSFDLITLFYSRFSILSVVIRVILGKQSSEQGIHLPELSNNRTCSQYQRERLQWAIEKISSLSVEGSPNFHSLQFLYSIAEHLATTPYMLPRFFFQQFYHVDFKISTTPQPDRNRPVSVHSGDTVPIRLDGSIISTHPSKIRSIIVIAEVIYISNHARNFVLTETVEPNEKNYFTAQFLLKFKLSCDIKFRIEFIDSTCRKQWKSSTCTVLPVIVRDVIKGKPHFNDGGQRFMMEIN